MRRGAHMRRLTTHQHRERRAQLTPELSDGFGCKEDLARCLRWFNEGVERRMRTQKSGTKHLRVVCATLPRVGARQRQRQGQAADDCKFFVSAKRDSDATWRVTRAYLDHTCTAEASAAKARCKRRSLTGHDLAELAERVVETRPKHGTKAKTVAATLASTCGVRLKDKNAAWRALRAAAVRRFGDPDDVGTLRSLLAAAKERDADVHFECGVVEGGLDDDAPVLDRVFVAPGFTCRVMANCDDNMIKKYVTCDGAHCRLGVLLTLVAADANPNLLPLAFAVVKSESVDTWSWFFGCAVAAFPKLSTWGEHLTVSCDGDKGAAAGVAAQLPTAQRVQCVKHRLRNIARRFGCNDTGDLVYGMFFKAAQAYTVQEHSELLQELKAACYEGWEYVLADDPKTWANALYPHRAWGKLTSNDSESFNGHPEVLSCRRDASITLLLDKCVMVTAKMMLERRLKFCSRVEEGAEEYKYAADLPPRIKGIMDKVKERAGLLSVDKLDVNEFIVGGLSGGGRHEVLLSAEHVAPSPQARLCTCGVPRVLGRPCSHVVAACEHDGRSYNQFIAPQLTTAAMRHLYSREVMGRTGWCATNATMRDDLRPPPWRKEENVVKADWADAHVIDLAAPADEAAPVRGPRNFRRRAAAVRQRSAGEEEERLLLTQSQHSKRRRRQGGRYKCSVCNKDTHNKRRCPERLAAAAADAAAAARGQV